MKKPWKMTLTETVTRLRTDAGQVPRIGILGIGQALRGDDAAGVAVARGLLRISKYSEHVLVLEAGVAPENQLGPLCTFAPDLVLLVDAAQMDASPGTVRWLSPEAAAGISASTHTVPPVMLARYLRAECNCEVALLGIQPAYNAMGTPISEEVEAAIEEVVRVLTEELLSALNEQ